MKKMVMYYLLLVMYFFRFEKISSTNRKIRSGTIDPISDFRTPYSLTEMLHEGLIEVNQCIDKISHNASSEISTLLGSIERTVHSMLDSYNGMIDSSKIHAIYRDDRDFLQSLIDRIDTMIQELERGNKIENQHVDLLHKDIDLLNQLRDKLKS